MKKKVLVGVPERLLDQVDLLAEYRSQTRSELIREALRNHLIQAQSVGAPVAIPVPALSLITGTAVPKREDAGLSLATN